MDLQKLSQEAFETAKAHGWHDEEQPDETLLMLIITEIAEAVQADRKDKHAYKDKFLASLKPDDDGEMFSMLFGQYIKNSVENTCAQVECHSCGNNMLLQAERHRHRLLRRAEDALQ